MVPGQRVDVTVLDFPHYSDDDAPMTLKRACELEFDGAFKPATLMAEHKRGRLVLEKIGRTYFVTRNAIRDMRSKCRLDPQERDPGSTFRQSEKTAMAALKPRDGSSATGASNAAQDALQMTLMGLKRH